MIAKVKTSKPKPSSPPEENMRVQLLIEKNAQGKKIIVLKLIGMTSNTSRHVVMKPTNAIKLGYSLISAGCTTWRPK